MTVVELITNIRSKMPNHFDESVFVGWINVLEDFMYTDHVKDKENPPLKEIENIGTDELSLLEFGVRWQLLYEYYIMGQICLLQEEYGKANNYFMLYNNLIDEFVMFYYPKMENPVRDYRMKNYR